MGKFPKKKWIVPLCCWFTLNQMQLVDSLSPHSLFHLTCCLNFSCLQWHYCYLCRVCISYPTYAQRTCKHSPQREAGQEISLVDWARTPCQSMLLSSRPGQTHEHVYSYTIVLINISAASSIIHTHTLYITHTQVYLHNLTGIIKQNVQLLPITIYTQRVSL